MKRRTSSFEAASYVPHRGDLLFDLHEEKVFRCERLDTFRDEKTGEKVRYGILVALGDEQSLSVRVFVEGNPDLYLGTDEDRSEGKGITVVHRTRRDTDEIREFQWDSTAKKFKYIKSLLPS
jgi:hypothetical protein